MSKVKIQSTEEWLEKYREIRPHYREYCKKLKILLEDLLNRNSIECHVIECRIKPEKSFSEKINREGKSYSDPLKEITDLCGIRLIVYYNNDIDKICELLKKEFIIDESRSVDKRKKLNEDQFGYLSVHKIITPNQNRTRLSEWSSFKGYFAEIQIRTVLQHAWASISHTLQYKRESEIPYEFRRKLVRLSGLLELADDEFLELRKQQKLFETTVGKNINDYDFEIPINAISILKYTQKTKIDKKIWDLTNKPKQIFEPIDFDLNPAEEWNQYPQLISACEINGINQISDLDSVLVSLSPKIPLFFQKFFISHKSEMQSLAGTRIHLIALILVGYNKKYQSAEEIELKIDWDRSYINQALKAGKIFWDR